TPGVGNLEGLQIYFSNTSTRPSFVTTMRSPSTCAVACTCLLASVSARVYWFSDPAEVHVPSDTPPGALIATFWSTVALNTALSIVASNAFRKRANSAVVVFGFLRAREMVPCKLKLQRPKIFSTYFKDWPVTRYSFRSFKSG